MHIATHTTPSTWKELLEEMRKYIELFTSGSEPTLAQSCHLMSLAIKAQELPPLARESEWGDEWLFNCLLQLIYDTEFTDTFTIGSYFDLLGNGRLIKIDPIKEIEGDDGNIYHPVYWTEPKQEEEDEPYEMY